MLTVQRLLLAALFCVALAGPGAAQQVTIKMANFVTPQSDVVRVMIRFIKAVESEVGDAVKFQTYWGGSLGRNPVTQFNMLKSGIADIVFVIPGYTPGQFPDFDVMELPFMARNGLEGSVAAWRMYKAGMITGLDDVKVLNLQSTGVNGFHARRPIRSLDDVKGLKIRAAGPILGAFARSVGAIPIGMDAPRVAEALNTGVIDGTLFSWDAVLVFGTNRVAKYHFTGPFGVVPMMNAMNKASWERMPPKVKAAIEKYGGEVMARWAGTSMDSTGAKGRSMAAKGKDHSIVEIGEADLAKGRKLAQPVFDDWIAKHADGKKKVDALERILAELRAGGGKGK